MDNPVRVTVRNTEGLLTIPPAKRVDLVHPVGQVRSLDSPAAELTRLLDFVPDVNGPLRRALTPDDLITLVLDEQTPSLAELLTVLLQHLTDASIQPENITILVPQAGKQEWVDELPDEFGDVRIEVHDPTQTKKLAYLATSKSGVRIYLNRNIVDADSLIVLSSRRYIPAQGYGGAEHLVYPAMSGNPDPQPRKPDPEQPGTRDLGHEILWLLGSPLLVHVIEGHGDSLAAIHVGLPDSAKLNKELQDNHWKCSLPGTGSLVVVTITGNPARIGMDDFVQALTTAHRAADTDGRIVLISEAAPELTAPFQVLRSISSASSAIRELQEMDRSTSAVRWAKIACKCHLYIASGWDDQTTEDLFATPIGSISEVQRLIDSATTVVLIEDGHKCRIVKPGE